LKVAYQVTMIVNYEMPLAVMAGPVPAIHAAPLNDRPPAAPDGVEARDKPGHDGRDLKAELIIDLNPNRANSRTPP